MKNKIKKEKLSHCLHPPIIMFDLDGVLLDSKGFILAAMESMSTSFYKWDPNILENTTALEIVRIFERSAHSRTFYTVKDMFNNFMKLLPNKTYRLLFLAKYGRRVKLLERKYCKFISGSVKTLKILSKKGIKMGIATNSYGYRVEQWIQRKKLSKIISLKCFVSRDDRRVLGSKPNPRPLLGLLLRIKQHFNLGKTDKKRVVFVGDNLSDIKAAKSANIQSIAVLSGHTSKYEFLSKTNKFKPDFILDDINQIPNILPKLFPDDF